MDGRADWYKDAIIYQAHVKTFADATSDGIGDFTGFRRRLDHLEALGVTAVWLQPFYPSPLRDDGYDIAEYCEVHPSYGTLDDFDAFLADAHARGIRVITELVINHTSDAHPWFQRARRAAPGTTERDFYVWNDTADRHPDVRIIFSDFETSNWTWDPVAGAYYWHRFYHHQPDLNFDNPAVRAAVFDVCDFWMRRGVDGVRLDAVPYLYERDGTNCENLPETHDLLRRLRAHVDANYGDRVLLAEANQWPEDAVEYFGAGPDGDECHMAFHFPVMPRLYMAVEREDRMPVVDILEQTPDIPRSAQWATFLRNHDELTLEMVTDEERDHMYRAYAGDERMRVNLGIRRRLAPLLGNDRRRIELMNVLLFSLPGTPVIYYGDEIGMGDNVDLGDRDGVRTPMQWSPDRNAGFSDAAPDQLYLPLVADGPYRHESLNVETQERDASSLLWWMRRLVAQAKQLPQLGRGTIRFLEPDNPRVLAFVRELDGEHPVLVVANLSRHAQAVELDLSDLIGAVPVEVFGRTRFAPVGEHGYHLTLGPHGAFWLELTEACHDAAGGAPVPTLTVGERWEHLLDPRAGGALAAALSRHVIAQRWYRGSRAPGASVGIERSIVLGPPGGRIALVVVDVQAPEQRRARYLVTLGALTPDGADDVATHHPDALVAHTVDAAGHPTGALVDAMVDDASVATLLTALGDPHADLDVRWATRTGQLLGAPGMIGRPRYEIDSTTVTVDDAAVIKLMRRVDFDPHPEVEVGAELTAQRFAHVPELLGSVQAVGDGPPITLAVIHDHITHDGDLYGRTLDELDRLVDRVVVEAPVPPAATSPQGLGQGGATIVPPELATLVDESIEHAELLGQRVAQLHLALAAGAGPAFAPDQLGAHGRRALEQSMRASIRAALRRLRQARGALAESDAPVATAVLGAEAALLARPRRLRSLDTITRIRVHGDLGLAQVLHTPAGDLVITDFDGDPALSTGQRRIRHSPLRDVADVLCSYSTATRRALLRAHRRGALTPTRRDEVERWLGAWERAVGATFLQAYLAVDAVHELVPCRAGRGLLLDLHVLDRRCREIDEIATEIIERGGSPRAGDLGALLGRLRDAVPGPDEGTVVAPGCDAEPVAAPPLAMPLRR